MPGNHKGCVQYHDYMIMVQLTDAEWSRRRPKSAPYSFEPFAQVHRQFTTHCWNYREAVERNYKAWRKANEGFSMRKGALADTGAAVEDFLYNPLAYVPFGHADCLSVVALDDFDPMHAFAAECRTTVEELSMGFCPKLESLGLNKGGPLTSFHELLGQPLLPSNNGDGYDPATQPFQQETPLLAFSRLRMDGLATLGQGLLFQQSLFRTMGIRITEVAEALRRFAERQPSKACMTAADVASARCVLLDLQGGEEIGLLTFCANYSVAMAFVAALRTLTYDDVYNSPTGGRLKKALGKTKLHQVLNKYVDELLCDNNKAMGANHVFRWSQSTLAVTASTFFSGEMVNCRGQVSGVTEFQVAPGHRHEVVTKLKNTVNLYQIGTGDLAWDLGARKRRTGLVPLADAMTCLKEQLSTFGRRGCPCHGRDVVDLSTTLYIPVPAVPGRSWPRGMQPLMAPIRKDHCSPLVDLLQAVRDRLCYDKEGCLNISRLLTATRQYGLPSSLRRTIGQLYQNFATILADPFLFDVVLDLYDVLVALYAVLTNYLPKALREGEPGSYGNEDRPSVLDIHRIEQLAELVHAIQNAMAHRTGKAFREAHLREMDIDFRGGLNQVLLAADVPVKCGMGSIRNYLPGRSRKRESVGATTFVSFLPGAKCHSLRLGTERDAALAFFEVDVPHILHVPSYADYMHESFHFADDLSMEGANDGKNGDDPKTLRLSEVFSNLLCLLFVFGGDKKVFGWHYICSYAQRPHSVGPDDESTIATLVEAALRLFLVYSAVPDQATPQALLEHEWKPLQFDEAVEQMDVVLSQMRRVLPEYERLSHTQAGAIRRYVKGRLREVYPDAIREMPYLWVRARGIFKLAVQHKRGPAIHSQFPEKVRKLVREALEQGMPISRAWHFPEVNKAPTGQEPGYDVLALSSLVLHEYLSPMNACSNHQVGLRRTGPHRDVDFERGDLPWFEVQVDRGSSAFFCPVPSARRERLRREIVVLKTFWDIASSLRARRLNDIVREVGLQPDITPCGKSPNRKPTSHSAGSRPRRSP